MTYMNAELELVRFAAEDVLATSNDPSVDTTANRCYPKPLSGEDIELEEDSFE